MQTAEISDEGVAALTDSMLQRGHQDLGETIAEAIGVELTLAREWAAGYKVLPVKHGRPTRILRPPSA